MSEFILNEIPFKMGFVDRVPTPEQGQCFLLYKQGGGEEASEIIHHGIKYSSADIRHRHYNRIVTFFLQSRKISKEFRVVMLDNDFYFNISVALSFELQDVKKYFFRSQMDENDIWRMIREITRDHDGRWDIQQEWKFKKELEDDIETKLNKINGVKFQIERLEVYPDEAAKKIGQSNKSTKVDIKLASNEAKIQIVKNEHTQKISESEQNLKWSKIKDLAAMMKTFGSLGPVVNEYLENNVNGEQLYEYIKEGKTQDLELLNEALNSDILTQTEAVEKLNEILGGNGLFQIESKKLTNKKPDDLQMDEKEVVYDAEETDSPKDGDFI